jgi:hypothetical protein
VQQKRGHFFHELMRDLVKSGFAPLSPHIAQDFAQLFLKVAWN